MSTLDAIRTARATWSLIAEPGDATAAALIKYFGPVDALDELLAVEGLGHHGDDIQAHLLRGRHAWSVGMKVAVSTPPVATAENFLIPEDAAWPTALNDLGQTSEAASFGLWYEGDITLMQECKVTVAGSRDCTDYGKEVTKLIAGDLANMSYQIVTSGSYGVGAVAAQAALSHVAPPIIVMASGLSERFPEGNKELQDAVIADGGLLISESPAGTFARRPTSLRRNVIMAALSVATVITEARQRSGDLTTAHHAHNMGRVVGAVPGSVFSGVSEGTHRLIQDHAAELVTSAEDVMRLIIKKNS